MSQKKNYLSSKSHYGGTVRVATLPLFSNERRKLLCYVSLIAALLMCSISFAQEKLTDNEKNALEKEPCHQVLQQRLLEDNMTPSQIEDLRLREAILGAQVNQHIIASRTTSKFARNSAKAASLVVPLDPDVDPNYTINPEYTIPVVFHVIHDGDENNIMSLAQAKKVLKIANEDLNGLSEFRNTIQDQFKSDESNVGIRLVLAQKDPSGNPTTGVTYDVNPGTYSTHQNNAASFKSSTKWPTNKYLNVWVVNGQQTYYFTDDDKPGGGSAYAFGPASDNGLTPNGTYTGITMAYWVGGDSVNGDNLDYQNFRHVFVHEFGHWLGLNHSWAKSTASGKPSNCNLDDGIADTPNTVGQQYKGKEFNNCTYTFASCGQDTNVHEFMNYTPCTSMFTNGQKEVMIGSLKSTVAGRNNIITQANLDATLYTSSPNTSRLIVSSEFGTKSNIFREVRDVETGKIENKANIYLENVSFASNLVGQTLTSTHFQTTNVPAGLSAEIKVIDATTAEFRLNGNATQHEISNSITNLILNFRNAAFNNATTSTIDNSTNIEFSVAFREKIGSPWAPLDYELLYNNSYGEKYGFYERRRTKLTYGNSIVELKFESDQLFVRLATPSGATGIVLDNNGNNPGVDQVSVLQYGDVVSPNSNWSVSNADASAEKGWKRVISQNQADIANYLNKDLYFGTYLKYGGRTFYQWIGFTLFKTEYGKMAVRLTDLAYGANPDEAITCGKGFHEGDSWMVRDLFFMEEARANDGTLYTKSMNFFVRGNTFKSTLSPSDYTVTNLPAGLTINSVQSVNNGRKLQFNLGGTYTNPDAGRVNTDITLKASAFTDTNNVGPSLTKEHQFQFYTNKEGYSVKSVNKTIDSNTDSYTVVGGIKFEYKVDYTKAIPEGRIIANGKSFGQSVKYSPRFMADAAGTNNAKLLGAGVMLDENTGMTFPIDLGDDIVVYSKDYTKWAGKEGYLGFQYAIGSFRHYLWIRIKVAANGESLEILDYALNRIIDTPIMTGELPPPTCDDGIQNGDEVNIDCGGSECQECQYCTAAGGGTTLNITQVTFGNINNSTTGNNAYVDYTNFSTTVEKGSQIPLTLDTNNSWSPNNLAVWIDWNNDKDFDDEGEKIFTKIGERPYNTVVTVPANAKSGATVRMRVRLAYGDNKTTTPCGVDAGIGEVEDYTINIGGTPNVAPTTSITSPAGNAQFQVGNAITIEASAADSDGSISKVEFFTGNTKLGEDTTAPYSYEWNNATAGNHSLTVKATDNEGTVTGSTAVTITVNAIPNIAPTARITSPVVNTQFQEGNAITIEATATDSDGTVSKVEFFNGATKIGEDTTAPYSFIWNGVSTGNHNLTVKATDNDTAVTESSAVAIIVSATPNVAPIANITSPSANAQFQQGNSITIQASASDSDGTITKVEFFNGTTKLGEDTTAPYSFTWNNATVGSHNLTIKATDNEAAVTESSAVAITVSATPNVAPIANITSPSANVQFLQGNSITIQASATDSDGTISKVEFFNGITKLGEDTTAPYSFVWNNATVGNHNLIIKATDNDAAVTESSAVAITVSATPNVAPTANITSPSANAQFQQGNSITIQASATDSDGTISKVEFFNGITKLGEDTTAPYSFTWNGATIGNHSLTVKATDNDAAVTESSFVSITINERIIGTDPCSASTANGLLHITKVAFGNINNSSVHTSYSNYTGISTVLNMGQSTPLEVTANNNHWTFNAVGVWIDWNNNGDFTDQGEKVYSKLGAGSYTSNVTPPVGVVLNTSLRMRVRIGYGSESKITACGVDTYIGEVEDYTVVVENGAPVNVAPTVNITSPVGGSQFNAGNAITVQASATDSDGTVSKVAFFDGTTSLGEDASAPYSVVLNNATVGSHIIKAIATDDKGATSEASVTITVNEITNVAPTVNITSPVANAQFDAGNIITIEANASDSDGSVAKVAFFDGNTSIGEDTSAPYSMELTNAIVGNHTLRVIATDNDGATAETTITVTVNEIDVTLPNYCTANGGQGVEAITNVTFANINNSSPVRSTSGYENFTSIVGNVPRGSSHNLSVTILGYRQGVDDEVYAWFDWNKDGDFEDAGEYNKLTKTTGLQGNVSITVPQDAALGSIAMRVRVAYYAQYNVPCGASTYGEVEDYVINISDTKSALDLSQKSSGSLVASPNPFNGNKLSLNFNSSESGTVKVQIFNTLGIKILDAVEDKSSNSVLAIDVNRELAPGLYVVQAQINGTAYSTKIVVE